MVRHMRWVFRVVMALVVGGMVLPPTAMSAVGDQLSAEEEPAATGPLSEADLKCDRERQTDGKQIAAIARRCLRFYRYDQGAETDAARDYGVLWLQATVKGRNGWCAVQVTSKIVLPVGLGLHNHAPEGAHKNGRQTDVTTVLELDADGTGSNARVTQEWIAFPKMHEAGFNRKKTAFNLSWRGSTARKLAFVHGIEVSWPADDPPEGIRFTTNLKLAECPA